MSIRFTFKPFGTFNNKTVYAYTLSNEKGFSVTAINYGATITHLFVPDKNGQAGDVVLGFENLQGYLEAPTTYMGSICGRFANRIRQGKFSIDGATFQVTRSENNKHCLHGGHFGFDKVYWEAQYQEDTQELIFTYHSKDGEEGFPGKLTAQVFYRLNKQQLEIAYRAFTDRATPINLTSHCYFNLSAGEENTIHQHELQLFASQYAEADEETLPTGNVLPCNKAFDFTNAELIGEKLIEQPKGFDHSFVITPTAALNKAAELSHPYSGRKMTVYTTQPAIHFYSGTFLDNSLKNTKANKVYQAFAGLCLEAQHFPDSPNINHFPNTILKPNEVYSEKTIYAFNT